METILINLSGKSRTVTKGGVNYLVTSISLVTEGVLNGSRGPLMYPMDELRKAADLWQDIPIVVYHPTENGSPISAKTDGVLDKSGVGFLRSPKVTNKKLVAEGWFDVEKTKSTDSRVYDALISGTPMEVSTGLGTTNEEAPAGASYLGQLYSHIARNHKPDHLAILPSGLGACSLNDGCGLHVNQAGDKEVVTLSLTEADLKDATDRFVQDVVNRVKVEPVCTNCSADGECETCKAKRKKVVEPVENEEELVDNELSHDDLRTRLMNLLNERYGTPLPSVFGVMSPVNPSNLWINDVFDKDFVYQDGPDQYRLGYKTDLRSDVVTLSDEAPVRVTVKKSYVANEQREFISRLNVDSEKKQTHNVGLKLVVNSLRKEADMAGKLNAEDREKLVDGLVENSGFQAADTWEEGDRDVLNAMTDEKLYGLAVAKQTLIDQQSVVNAVGKHVGQHKLEDLPAAVENAFKPFKKKKVSKADDEEEDAADDGDDEEMETNNEPELRVPRQMTEAEFMKMAPPSIRADLEFSRATQNKEKQELIGTITANVSGDELDQAVNYLRTKPLTELRIIANVASKPATPEFDVNVRRSPNYGGMAVPTGNRLTTNKRPGEGPKPVTINWAEISKSNAG